MKADYYMGDLYPNLAYFSTRADTIPEAADQTSLVDQQETSQKNPIDVSPKPIGVFGGQSVLYLF